MVLGINPWRALTRPETYVGQLREVTSLARTAAHWPLGFVQAASTTALVHVDDAARLIEVNTPVVLVHGYAANKSNWWVIAGALRGAHYRHVSGFNYNPFRYDIPQLAGQLVEHVERQLDKHNADQVLLVGHSMGGIVARWALQELGLAEICPNAATVASPHHGAPVARLAGPLAKLWFGRSAAQLSPDSEIIAHLNALTCPGTRLAAYWSNLDVVVPGWAAKAPANIGQVQNLYIPDQGHLSIMLDAGLRKSLAIELARGVEVTDLRTPGLRLVRHAA